MSSINSLSSKDNILIVSNGCGGGHIQTERYVAKVLTDSNPNLRTVSIDVYKNTLGETIGNYIIESWAQKQKEGDVAGLNGYLSLQCLDRYLLSIFAFLGFLYRIFRDDIDAIVTVQPISSGGLLTAARVANFVNWLFGLKKEAITVTMVLTELPTSYTENFFYNLRYLSDADRSIFKLVAARPLLENGEDETTFWQRTCALPLENLDYVGPGELPVRAAFKQQYKTGVPVRLMLKAPSDQLEAIQKCAGLNLDRNEEEIAISIRPEDAVATIRLGGQSCLEAAKSYVRTLMDNARHRNERQFIFVLCGGDKGANSLFQHICDLVNEKRREDGYERIHVLPLAFQDDKHIAPLAHRSDLDIIKSGGATAMEVLALPPQGDVFIHASPPEGSNVAVEEMLLTEGMPIWEGGNARYLKRHLGAQIVSPGTFAIQINLATDSAIA